MRRLSLSLLLPAALLAPSAARAEGPPPFELKDGDRVVLVGNTLIEREQRYGYWETALTARFPDRHVTFRNLGWSGDTVWAESRGGFGTPADGFKKLTEGVRGLKPTVLIVGYGGNEAFAGKEGLPRFEKGLNDLLDAVTPPGCRVVLLSPSRQEGPLGRSLPDPTAHNKNLELYGETIRAVARKRGGRFVDLLGPPVDPLTPETEDGLQLTARGYALRTRRVENYLGLKEIGWNVTLKPDGTAQSRGARVEVTEPGKAFRITDAVLPQPPLPDAGAGEAPQDGAGGVLAVQGLAPGRYTLTIDGKPGCTESAEVWARGVPVPKAPDRDQAEKLRAAVVEKNRLYFHRWRPQNETYLFGFRKNEQGQNAREVPLFEPLVEEQEKLIAKLRVPVAHVYEIKKEAGK